MNENCNLNIKGPVLRLYGSFSIINCQLRFPVGYQDYGSWGYLT